MCEPLSIRRTGVRDSNTAAVIVSVDEYTIKTIFGDGTVELSILDRESRMHKPDSMNIDDNNEHR